MRYNDIPFQHRLSVRQALAGVLAAFMISLIMGAINFFIDMKRQLVAIDERMQDTLTIVDDSAAQAAYSLDRQLAAEIINGILHVDYVVHAILYDDMDRKIAELQRDGTPDQGKLFSFLYGNTRSLERELWIDSLDLYAGRLYIQIEMDSAMSPFYDRAFSTFIFSLFQNMVLAGALLLLFHLMITRPMLDLRDNLGAINPEEPQMLSFNQRKNRKDEIALLVEKINSFLVAIDEKQKEQKKTEEELLQAKRAAELANKAKGEFFANMSHEIRSPLNAIMGMSELLSESGLSQKQKQYADIVNNAGENLLELINNILDISRIEAGRDQPEFVEFNLHDLIYRSIDLLSLRAEKKHLEIECTITDDVPLLISSDPLRLKQVFNNLLTNAVKFTQKGKIIFISRLKEGYSDVVEFIIRDTGTGIDYEHQKMVFEPFTMIDSSLSRRQGGSGLGLSIVKRNVEMLGGEISLTSEPNHGTEFKFSIQINSVTSHSGSKKSEPVSKAYDSSIMRNMNILLVEDSEDNALLIESYLKDTGCNLSLADNGLRAVEIAEKHSFDVILMDVQMPEMDGYTATKMIRSIETKVKDPVILALTAHAMPEHERMSFEAGCNGHLTKPLKRIDLIQAILQHFKN